MSQRFFHETGVFRLCVKTEPLAKVGVSRNPFKCVFHFRRCFDEYDSLRIPWG